MTSSTRADGFDQGWTLDGAGNFSEFDNDGTPQTRTTNAANEITAIGGGMTPTYDRTGNMISGPKSGEETTLVHYVYDAWNRLVGVYQDDGDGILEQGAGDALITNNHYDGLNRRVKKTGTNDWHRYFYNQDWQVLEDRYGIGLADTRSISQYVWSPRYVDSPIVCLRDGNHDGDVSDPYNQWGTETSDWRRYYLTDANHNVTTTIRIDRDNLVAVTAAIARNVYTPYGAVTQYGDDWTDTSAEIGFDGPRYCGYFSDVETGLYQVRNRYYDPGLSTWISRDPVGYNAGSNLYAYCGADPLNSTDPSGLANFWNPITWGISNPSQGWSGFFNPFSSENRAALGGYYSGLGSGAKNVGKGLAEPVLIIADVPHAGYAKLTGQTIEEFEPWSMWGEYSKQRQLQGNTPLQTLAEGAPPLAANVVTLGWYGYGTGAYEYYQTGDPTAFQTASSGPLLGALAVKGMVKSGAPSNLAGIEAKIASRTATRAEWQLYSQQLRTTGQTAEFSGNGSFLQFDRRVVARQFYGDAGFSGGRLEAHLQGIDFSKPVTVETIPQGAYVEQWLKGGRIGNYFSPLGQAPETSGIARYMRTPIGFQANQDIRVLRSYAAPITDTWPLGPSYPSQTPGGGVQYFTPKPSAFDPVFGW